MATKSYASESTAKAAMTRQELSDTEFTPVLVETQEQADAQGYTSDAVGRYVIESVDDNWTADEGELKQPTVFDESFKSAGQATSAAKAAGLKTEEYDLRRDDKTHEFKIIPVVRTEATTAPDFDPVEEEQVEEEEEAPQETIQIANTIDANRSESTCEKPVATTHRICSEMYDSAAKEGRPTPARKDLVNACMEAGVTKWTARTQVQVWLKRHTSALQAAMQAQAALDRAAEIQADPSEEEIEAVLEEESDAVPGL